MTGAAQTSFQRLGLLPDADARAIRRAYAHELKKIDQAADATGFQQLRGAYEAALQFLEWQATQETDGDVVQVVQPAPAPEPDSPDQLADAVMTGFVGTLAALARQNSAASAAPYVAALQEALQDERLFGIEARLGFEWRVAVLLVQGWRPGHQALLVAAEEVFNWREGTRLAGLGQAGAVLDRVLEERALYDSQSMSTRDGQRRILKLLRDERTPDDAQIRQYVTPFLLLVERCPHWLVVVAPRAAIVYWQDRYAQMRADDNDAAALPLARVKVILTRVMKILFGGLLLLVALAVCGHVFKLFSPLAPPTEQNRHLTHVPGAPVPQARLDDIFRRVDFVPAPAEARTPLAGEYDVFLDTDGRVAGATLVTASGNARFDAAVRAAIMASAPMPPQTMSVFNLTFRYTPPPDGKGAPP